MAENIKVAFPDEHFQWLEEVRKARGWDSVQEAIRSVVEDAFRMHKKGLYTLMYAPAAAPAGKPAEKPAEKTK